MRDWRQAAGRMRAELDRAALNERARLMVAVLIKATLMRGRVRVVLPDLTQLDKLLKIGKGHLEEVTSKLDSCGIARFRKVAEGWEVIVQPDSRLWTGIEWRYERERLEDYLAYLERMPGQAQGELMPEPNLAETVAVCGVEGIATEAQRHRVPKMGTGGEPTRAITRIPDGFGSSPLNVQGSKPVRHLSIERCGVPPRANAASPRGTSEAELMARCLAVFGPATMKQYGGGWRSRARQDADLLERVLNDTERAVKDAEVKTTPAQYANYRWQEWAQGHRGAEAQSKA